MTGKELALWQTRLTEAKAELRGGIQLAALLEAFGRIDDPVLREEIIIMIEIISQNPSLLRRSLMALH
jgi:hypothetical protein